MVNILLSVLFNKVQWKHAKSANILAHITPVLYQLWYSNLHCRLFRSQIPSLTQGEELTCKIRSITRSIYILTQSLKNQILPSNYYFFPCKRLRKQNPPISISKYWKQWCVYVGLIQQDFITVHKIKHYHEVSKKFYPFFVFNVWWTSHFSIKLLIWKRNNKRTTTRCKCIAMSR